VGWILHDEELCDVVRVVKCEMLRWAGCVASVYIT